LLSRCRAPSEHHTVPSPRHDYHDQSSGLAEIYLRLMMLILILLMAWSRYNQFVQKEVRGWFQTAVTSGNYHEVNPRDKVLTALMIEKLRWVAPSVPSMGAGAGGDHRSIHARNRLAPPQRPRPAPTPSRPAPTLSRPAPTPSPLAPLRFPCVPTFSQARPVCIRVATRHHRGRGTSARRELKLPMLTLLLMPPQAQERQTVECRL
jgi:hypothetical protein